MALRKLSETDKQDILTQYRLPGETTSTLADRYGVSSSTISRVLKQRLPEAEYSLLIQQKRSNASSQEPEVDGAASPPSEEKGQGDISPVASREVQSSPPAVAPPRLRTQMSPLVAEDGEPGAAPPLKGSLPERPKKKVIPYKGASAADSPGDPDDAPTAIAPPWDGESASTAADYAADDDLDSEEDLDDDSDLDDWDEDDEADEEDSGSRMPAFTAHAQFEVRPFTAGLLDKPCYLIVDRLSELITRPLQDFAELGQIPTEEGLARTLPIFDNHRIARRFSQRNQRVVKVPDGGMIQKTQSYLQAKGITRLLIDGQVYALN